LNSQKVIRSYYVISGLYTLSASFTWGINTLFLLDAGLNIFEVFIANAFFSAGMTLFEIPTGVLADTRGRRLSFLLSTVVLSLGTLGYVGIALLSGGLLWFCVMSVVLGLGYTFYSGAVEAWLVDALNATGFQNPLDKIFARSEFVSGAAMVAGTVGGGFLGDINLAIPFIGRALLLLLLFVFAYFYMHDIGYQPRALTLARLPAEMQAVAAASFKFGWGNASIRLIMLMSFVQTGFIYWSFYAWQPYFLGLLGKDVAWVAGVIAALVSLATMAGNRLVEWFTQFCGKRTTLMLWAAGVGALATVGVGVARSFWLVVPLFLVYMATTGIITPVLQAYLHQVIPSEQRAAIVSFSSMAGSGGGILGQTGLGYLARVNSIASGYIAGGAVSLIVLPLVTLLRRLNDPADQIVGKAGRGSACAAQGIPDISSVDTTTS
jgi:MFS family permease